MTALLPPGRLATLDRQHPLARGLTFYTTFDVVGSAPPNLANPGQSSISAAGSRATTRHGPGYASVAAGQAAVFEDRADYSFDGDIDFSLLVALEVTGLGSGSTPGVMSKRASSTNEGRWNLNANTALTRLVMNWTAGGVSQSASWTLPNGYPTSGYHTFALTRKAGGIWDAWIDAVHLGTLVDTPFPANEDTTNNLTIGALTPTSTSATYGRYVVAAFWKHRALTHAEVVRLTADPRQLLRRDTAGPLIATLPAAAPVLAAPVGATIMPAAAAPLARVSDNRTATALAAAAGIAATAPQAIATGHVRARPAVASALGFAAAEPSVDIESITSAVPVAVLDAGGWQAVNAATLDAALDEAEADDADYIQSPAPTGSGSIVRLKLGVLATPTLTQTLVVRYRYAAERDAPIGLTVTLIDIDSDTAVASWTHTNPGTAWITAEHTLSALDMDRITNAANLALTFSAALP